MANDDEDGVTESKQPSSGDGEMPATGPQPTSVTTARLHMTSRHLSGPDAAVPDSQSPAQQAGSPQAGGSPAQPGAHARPAEPDAGPVPDAPPAEGTAVAEAGQAGQPGAGVSPAGAGQAETAAGAAGQDRGPDTARLSLREVEQGLYGPPDSPGQPAGYGRYEPPVQPGRGSAYASDDPFRAYRPAGPYGVTPGAPDQPAQPDAVAGQPGGEPLDDQAAAQAPRYAPAAQYQPPDPYAAGPYPPYPGADPYGPPEDYNPSDPYGPDPYAPGAYSSAYLYGAEPYRSAAAAGPQEAAGYGPADQDRPPAAPPAQYAPPAPAPQPGPGPAPGNNPPGPFPAPVAAPGAAFPPAGPGYGPPPGHPAEGPIAVPPGYAPGPGPVAPAGMPPAGMPPPAQPPGPGADVAPGLSQEYLLPGRRRAPDPGWRRTVFHATGGLVRVPSSAAELRRRDMVTRARTPVAGGHHRVAILSLKGGVGKTTTTVGLGATLASLRGDRVIAVDANPDRGTLSDKVRLETAATVRDLLNERGNINRYADVRTFTSQASSRLEVLASDRDPAVSVAFSDQDYAMVSSVLEHYYSICLTDCGTGLLHSAMSAVLGLADQMVLVSSPSVDGARSASATLDWLAAHSYGDLVRNGVVVLSAVRPRSRSSVDLNRLEEHFAGRCRAVVRIPYDAHLEEGAEVELELLSRPTAEAYLALAAVIGDGLATPARSRRL